MQRYGNTAEIIPIRHDNQRKHADGGMLDGMNSAHEVQIARLGRRFVLIEQEKDYVDVMRQEAKDWLGEAAADVFTINCAGVDPSGRLF